MSLENTYAISILFFSYGLWVVLCMIQGFRIYRKDLRNIGRDIKNAYQPMHHSINKTKSKKRKESKLYLRANTICAFIPVFNIMVFSFNINNKVKKEL